MLNTLSQDLRFALRMLRKSPGFTVVSVVVLALGIGANTAVFSVINAVLLRPLPYPQPEQLLLLRERMPSFDEGGSVSYPNYLDWRASQHTCTDLVFERRDTFNVSFPPATGAAPEQLVGAQASANFLSLLGVKPALGRGFTEQEDTPGGPKSVLIGDTLWRRRFNANPRIVGTRLTVEGLPYEIIGVMPPGFDFPRKAEVYVTLGDLRREPHFLRRDNRTGFVVLGRRKPGVTLAQASEDINGIARELARRYPDANAGHWAVVKTLLEYSVGDYRQSLYLLLGAVLCVLLIACANVANLQLARVSGREKELALRAALGASRGRLVRQMLTESVLLGLLGGAAALVLSLWAMDAIVALSPSRAPRFQDTHLDLTTLLFTAFVALATGVAVGVWPAWRISGAAAMSQALHEGSARGAAGGAAQRRLRSGLVVAQVALTVALLAVAGLTLKSFWRVLSEPVGFRPDHLLTVSVSPPDARYKGAQVPLFYARLLERVRALPGVAAAATAANLPFDNQDWEATVHVTGTPDDPPGTEPVSELNFVSPGYFKTMGIPLLRGRDFGPEDVAGKPCTVIIDERLATRFFPGQDPLGKRIDDVQLQTNMDPNAPPQPFTVVGVVGTTRNDAPGGAAPGLDSVPQMHLCRQQYDEQTTATLVVRAASGDPLRLADSVRRVVLTMDPELPVAEVTTMEARIADSVAPRRLTMVLLGTFAGLAFVLASIGVYGVMALTVTQRTRELGIRLALGAQRSAVLGLLIRQGAALVGAGLGLGLVAALVAGRLMANLLYNVNGSDPLILGSVAIVLTGAALLACWLPAQRATRVDPMVALRED